VLVTATLPATVFAAGARRVSVAVAEPDIAAIVRTVGGGDVEVFSLFEGCILRKDLMVEPGVLERLARADAVVWTGFLNESAAITASLTGRAKTGERPKAGTPPWIDVSRGVTYVNVPTSTCFGYVDPTLAAGDPFFWLNPENGGVIAHNVAEGLGDLRPEARPTYLKNAAEFSSALEKDILRWKEALKPLAHLRVFCTQCGWQNLSKLKGPSIVVCKSSPGELPTPAILVKHVMEMKPEVILLDPNTPAEYGKAFREQPGLKVMEVASSIERVPEATSYSALFDNMVRVLQEAARR